MRGVAFWMQYRKVSDTLVLEFPSGAKWLHAPHAQKLFRKALRAISALRALLKVLIKLFQPRGAGSR